MGEPIDQQLGNINRRLELVYTALLHIAHSGMSQADLQAMAEDLAGVGGKYAAPELGDAEEVKA